MERNAGGLVSKTWPGITVESFLFLLSSLVTTKALDYPYFAPFSPLVKEELGDAIIKLRSSKRLKRNPLLTKNKKRGN